MKLIALAFVCASVPLLAQAPNASSGGVSVPSLGFVASQTPPQLRPILGIPGAARLGNPLLLPNTVTQIYMAPGQAFALAAGAPGASLGMILLEGVAGAAQSLPVRPIPGAMNQADLLAFGPLGRSAVVYARQTNHIQVLTGLPRSPQVSLDIPNVSVASTPQKLAVSDDAQVVLIVDAAGTVYSLSQGAVPTVVHHSPDVSAVAFLAGSHDAVICDRSLNSAAFLHNSSVTAVAAVAGFSDGCQPEDAASTADGKTILVACPSQQALLSVDRASGLTRTYSVPLAPGAFDRLSARDTFLISPPQGSTYWLVVWGPGGPVTSFIAAAGGVGQGPGH